MPEPDVQPIPLYHKVILATGPRITSEEGFVDAPVEVREIKYKTNEELAQALYEAAKDFKNLDPRIVALLCGASMAIRKLLEKKKPNVRIPRPPANR